MGWKTPRSLMFNVNTLDNSPDLLEEPVLPIITKRSDLLRMYFKLLWRDSKWRVVAGFLAIVSVIVAAYVFNINLLFLLLPVGMAWVTPTSRSTGDLITAAIWNQDVVSNVIALEQRVQTLLVYTREESSFTGVYAVDSPDNGQEAYYSWQMPADFLALVSANIAFNPYATETITFDLTINYAANGEPENTHTGSVVNATLGTTANQLAEYDFTALLASLGAGDYVGMEVSSKTSTEYIMLIRITYTTAL